MKLLLEQWKTFVNEDGHAKDMKLDPADVDMKLPLDKRIVLQADSEKYNRGLIVTWREDGGYDVAYWYGTPDNIVEAELKGDGKSFGYIKDVYLGYHPELDSTKKDDENE
tara:strand:+ start:179 stop:508 length:330 start_codon:yes stop_codon:yes gene_type:complete